MIMPYFTIVHWLAIGFFLILFIGLAFLSAKAKSPSMIVGGIFASFLVSTFGGVMSIVVLEKYTKIGKMTGVKERRILFNESLFIEGYIKNVGKFPIKYCTINVKLVNQDRRQFGKGTFFKSAGFDLFGGKDKKKQAKPNTVQKEKVIKFKNLLKPGHAEVFSMSVPYPSYFKNTLIIKKMSCH